MKVLHDHFRAYDPARARLEAEARTLSRLDHPNIVRVHDAGEEPDGTLWLAMDLLEGITLSDMLEKERPGFARAIGIMQELCAGLAHAHDRGAIHGDIKPSNVIVAKRVDEHGAHREHAVLVDFDGSSARALAAAGTPEYASPEHCLGESLDARSDVYSCGVLLYQLLVGEVPFAGGDVQSLLRAHLLTTPPKPSARVPELDARVDAIVGSMLAKAPADRPPSMEHVEARLRGLLRSCAVSPPPVRNDAQDFARARLRSGDVEQEALAELLAHGPASRVIARVARLLSRVEGGKRDLSALRALALLREPRALVPFAHRLLDENEEEDEALVHVASRPIERLLVYGGAASSRALWSARVTRSASPERRARFVRWMATVGRAAYPVLRAGLAKLVPHAKSERHATIVADVLMVLSVTSAYDEDLADLVTSFVSSPDEAVREQALAFLVCGRVERVLASRRRRIASA